MTTAALNLTGDSPRMNPAVSAPSDANLYHRGMSTLLAA